MNPLHLQSVLKSSKMSSSLTPIMLSLLDHCLPQPPAFLSSERYVTAKLTCELTWLLTFPFLILKWYCMIRVPLLFYLVSDTQYTLNNTWWVNEMTYGSIHLLVLTDTEPQQGCTSIKNWTRIVTLQFMVVFELLESFLMHVQCILKILMKCKYFLLITILNNS